MERDRAGGLWQDAAAIFLQYCDLCTLCRVCSSAKCLQTACALFLRENAASLLEQAVIGTAIVPKYAVEKPLTRLAWLVRQGGYEQELLNSARGHLLSVPCVPAKAAALLAWHGFRLNWSDIVAAANSQVAGVEVWVAVGAVKDAPMLANLLCTNTSKPPWHGDDETLNGLLGPMSEESVRMADFAVALQITMPQVAAEAIHFAVNMRSGHIGAAILLQQLSLMCRSDIQRPQQLITAADGTEATVQGNNSSLSEQQMEQQMGQHIQSSSAWQVFFRLDMGQLLFAAALRGSEGVLRAVAGLFPADAPSAAVIGSYLETAVQQGQPGVVEGLQHFPAFKQLDATFIGNLLLQTLRQQACCVTEALAATPQAQQLPVEVTVAALEVSFASLDWCSNSEHDKWTALRLPGLQQLDAADLVAVFKTALVHRPPLTDSPVDARGSLVPAAEHNPFCMLLNHPAAAQIPPGQLLELVQIPLQQADFVYSALLLKQPAAQQLQSWHILQLIKETLNVTHARREIYEETYGQAGPWFHVLDALCELPEAGEIAAEDIEHLLTDPVPQRPVKFLLLGLHGARSLDIAFIERYITEAATQRDSDLVEAMLQLPATDDLGAEFLVALIIDLLAADDRETAEVLINYLLALPLDVDEHLQFEYKVYRMFSVVVRQSHPDRYAKDTHHTDKDLLAKLCSSDLALWLTDGQRVVGGKLLKDALIVGHTWALEALLTLPGVSGLDASTVSELLALYLNIPGRVVPDLGLLKEICSLDPASKIGSAALQGLLGTAIAKQSALMDACTSIYSNKIPDRKLLDLWDEVVGQLCHMSSCGDPATQQVGAAAVDTLLQQAIQQRNAAAIVRLCALPAVAELAVDAAANLVRQAMRARLCRADERSHGSARKAIRALVGLQSLQQSDASALVSLLRLTLITEGGYEFLCGLTEVPAAQQMSRADVACLMNIAACRGDVAAMQRLRQLIAAAVV